MGHPPDAAGSGSEVRQIGVDEFAEKLRSEARQIIHTLAQREETLRTMKDSKLIRVQEKKALAIMNWLAELLKASQLISPDKTGKIAIAFNMPGHPARKQS